MTLVVDAVCGLDLLQIRVGVGDQVFGGEHETADAAIKRDADEDSAVSPAADHDIAGGGNDDGRVGCVFQEAECALLRDRHRCEVAAVNAGTVLPVRLNPIDTRDAGPCA